MTKTETTSPHFYYLIYDWETGGFDATKHAGIELGMIAVRSDNFEELGRISTMIQPYGNLDYTEGALQANGITLEEIIEGELPEYLVGQIIELASKAKGAGRDGKAILVAHNSDFDRNFMQQIFEVTGKSKEMPKIFAGTTDYYGNFQPHAIDTIDLARLKWNKNEEEITNFKLITVCQKVGIDLVGAHRAINDVISTKDLLLHFKKCIRAEQSDNKTETRFRDSLKFEY
jgi:DNA polymerase III alpha subunit (gram-positive type)